MGVKVRFFFLSAFLLTACTAPNPAVKRIALLAPFEGTYREVGYDALYPVRLGMADASAVDVVLLSIDDGGSAEAATSRATTLAQDPTVLAVLVAGATSTDSRVLEALDDVPVVVIGDWNAAAGDGRFVLTSEAVRQRLTSHETDVYRAAETAETVVGGETFALKQFSLLASDPSGVTVVTSAAPPMQDFRTRIINSDLFVPEPGLLATLAYDAGYLLSQTVAQSDSRAAVTDALHAAYFMGVSMAPIRFDDAGYWLNAPIYEYLYVDGSLALSR